MPSCYHAVDMAKMNLSRVEGKQRALGYAPYRESGSVPYNLMHLNDTVFFEWSLMNVQCRDLTPLLPYGFTRQSMWLHKKEWGYTLPRDKKHDFKSSHLRFGKPTIQTKWGPAYEYRRGYYLLRFKRGSLYFDHPIAPNNQCLLHRLVVFEHLLNTNPESEFLKRIHGILTLDPHAQIHHKNGVTSDNRVENLEINWSKKHIYKHWHGAEELKESFLSALENRDYLTKAEILDILKEHYDRKDVVPKG